MISPAMSYETIGPASIAFETWCGERKDNIFSSWALLPRRRAIVSNIDLLPRGSNAASLCYRWQEGCAGLAR
jgi:hypothetical protein